MYVKEFLMNSIEALVYPTMLNYNLFGGKKMLDQVSEKMDRLL